MQVELYLKEENQTIIFAILGQECQILPSLERLKCPLMKVKVYLLRNIPKEVPFLLFVTLPFILRLVFENAVHFVGNLQLGH